MPSFVSRLACILLAGLLPAAAAAAPTTAERSPFYQGHWWTSTRPGSGFDIFAVGSQGMAIWYTYDEGGRPVWYTAQGALADKAWPLLRHRWEAGRKATPTTVGSLALGFLNTESINVAWTLGSRQGSVTIQPFVAAGSTTEVDHSGSWFAPAQDGWGLTVTEQADVIGGVLYTYGPDGEPTWAAGFGRERNAAELFSFSGSCPWCPWTPSQPRSVGRVGFEFEGDWRMTLRSSLGLLMAPGILAGGSATMNQLSIPASGRPADRRLAAFADEQGLKGYLSTGMGQLVYGGGVDFSAAPPAPTFSSTNLVEAGVDEAGLFKSDGRWLYTFRHEGGAPTPFVRVAELSADGTRLSLAGGLLLQGIPTSTVPSAGLYVAGDRIVTVAGSIPTAAYYGWGSSGSWSKGKTYVEVFRGAGPTATSLWRAEIDGHVYDSRRIGDRLYVVSRFVPDVPGYLPGAGTAAQVEANRALLAATPLSALLPNVRIDGGAPQPLVQTSSVFAPPQGSRSPLASLILVTTIDLATPRIVQSLAIAGSVDALYMSTGNLYLTTARTEYRYPNNPLALMPEPAGLTTDIHQLRVGADGMEIVGSGSVEGHLGADFSMAAFRLGEHEGRLRVMSSSSTWWVGTANRLTVLEPSTVTPGVLRRVSTLPNAQRPAAIGKPTEQLYASRFVGDRGYAVTFRRTDPLYVLDLSSDTDPRIGGELQVTGYSEYLHPLPGGLMLGVGKEATSSGLFQGVQVSLFDVADAAQPRELQKLVLGRRGSESALLDHYQAFSALPLADGSTGFAFPVRIHDGPDVGATAYYPWKESGLYRFQLQGTGSSARLAYGASLVTHSVLRGDAVPNYDDPAVAGGRSLLTPNATVYVGKGRYWLQDAAGTVTGPY